MEAKIVLACVAGVAATWGCILAVDVVLQLGLARQEKDDLVAYLLCL